MKNTMMQWRQRALEAERELAEVRRDLSELKAGCKAFNDMQESITRLQNSDLPK